MDLDIKFDDLVDGYFKSYSVTGDALGITGNLKTKLYYNVTHFAGADGVVRPDDSDGAIKMVELDAVTGFVVSNTAKTNRRPVETMGVYTDGMLVDPKVISIAAVIDVRGDDKISELTKMFEGKVPVKLFSNKFTGEGSFQVTGEFDESNGKYFVMTSLGFTPGRSKNSAAVAIVLEEVRSYQIDEREYVQYEIIKNPATNLHEGEHIPPDSETYKRAMEMVKQESNGGATPQRNLVESKGRVTLGNKEANKIKR